MKLHIPKKKALVAYNQDLECHVYEGVTMEVMKIDEYMIFRARLGGIKAVVENQKVEKTKERTVYSLVEATIKKANVQED